LARRFFSALILAILASAAFGQAFGRFGYEQSVSVPGFRVDKDGFTANDPQADKIRFAKPSKDWKPLATSSVEQTVQLSPLAGGPSRALFNLAGVGFSLYFDSGIDLKVGALSAPYLSWEQGSVANGVATPETRWLVLSFRDRQPSLVFGFPKGHASLIVTGKAGAWSIKTAEKFQGWVRIGLPQGIDSQLANSAGSLGKIAKVAAARASLWTSMPPRLLKTSVASDLGSVTATWQFDQPGAVVPPAAMLANLGGYLLKVQTPSARMAGWTEAGPTDVLIGNSLTVRFPVKRIPTGRCLAVGSQLSNPIGTASPQDIPSVAQLALESLVAERDTMTRKASEDTTAEFIGQAHYFLEPWTRQQLPFDRMGRGIDLAAAHAFLMQAATSTSRSTSESNSLLTSVCWRQDWASWKVWTDDVAISQRSGALAALAGAFCPEADRRLAAAMFQAGLSGARGLNVWRKRKGLIDQLPKLQEPLYGVRKEIFGLEGSEVDGEAFTRSLFSPLRVFSEGAVALVKDGANLVVQSEPIEAKQYVLMLASAYPIEVKPLLNVSYFKVDAALGFTEVHYIPDTAGTCKFKITLPSFGKTPPPAAQVPIYSEKAF